MEDDASFGAHVWVALGIQSGAARLETALYFYQSRRPAWDRTRARWDSVVQDHVEEFRTANRRSIFAEPNGRTRDHTTRRVRDVLRSRVGDHQPGGVGLALFSNRELLK